MATRAFFRQRSLSKFYRHFANFFGAYLFDLSICAIVVAVGSDELRSRHCYPDTEPLREVIKDNETGKMVNFFDKTTLINTICHLLDNPQERQRLGENARQFAINNYDLQSVCLPKQIQWVKTLAEL